MKRNQVPVSHLLAIQEKAIEEYAWNYMNNDVHLCSLCGNSGIIDTRGTAISGAGIDAGKLNHCICPNGRAMREEGTDLMAALTHHRVHAELIKKHYES